MKHLLCPSMMCADYGHLADEVPALDEAGADLFHCDVMDGSFVPNMTMGLMDIKAVRANTEKPVDAHLMIENPGDKVDWFIDAGVNIVYIHPESERYCVRTMAHIKDRGAAAGIAVNPDTSIETIHELLNLADHVMVMTVNPGFAGQKFIQFTREKRARLVDLKARYGYNILVDGSCSPEVVRDLTALGVDGFILGTSSLFGKNRPYKEILEELRQGKERQA